MDTQLSDNAMKILHESNIFLEPPFLHWKLIQYFESHKVLYVSTSIMLFDDDDPGFMLTIIQNNNVIFQQRPYSGSNVAYKAAIEYIINNLNTIIDEHRKTIYGRNNSNNSESSDNK